MRSWIYFLALIPAAHAAHVPTIDELLKLSTPGVARISPDGRYVAYTITEPDFEQNA